MRSQDRDAGLLPGLDGLPGLEAVRDQLTDWVAVIRAEQSRLAAGATVTRKMWKNLVFAGGPGSGKSRAAAAVGRAYRDLGVLSSGHLSEVAAPSLLAADLQQAGALAREAASRGRGGVLMITGVDGCATLREADQQVLRCLYEVLTERRDDLAVILAGNAEQLQDLLQASPALAARFPAVIDFPGYDSGQLVAIFTALAGEAGFTLDSTAASRAADILGREARDSQSGNARLAIRLLNQATARQGRRIAATPEPTDTELCTLLAEDIPRLSSAEQADPADPRPGQYL